MRLQKLEIRKGTYLNGKLIENFLKRKPDHFDLLSLQHTIQSEHQVTVRVEDGGLRILSDLEASEYNNHRFGLLVKRLYKRHKLQLQVDHSSFTTEELRTHDRRIEIQGKVLQGVEKTLKKELPQEIGIQHSTSFEKELPKLFS